MYFFLFKCCFICLYTDVDECSLNTHDCDSRSERRTCTNTQGSFTCGCQSGYKIAADKKTCNGWNFSLFFVWIKEVYYYIVLWTWTNINRTNIHRYNFCLAILMNVLWLKPVMLCICGFFSSDIDECALGGHGCAQVCLNNPGGFGCGCRSGYLLEADQKSCRGKIKIHRNQRFSEMLK